MVAIVVVVVAVTRKPHPPPALPPPPLADADTNYNAQTAEFLFDVVKGSADQAMAQIKSLEARGAQAFTAATVLLGLASFGSFTTGHVSRAAFAFFVIALAGYLAAAFASLRLLLPAEVSGLPSTAAMWAQLRQREVPAVKASLTQTLATAEPINDDAIKQRRRWAGRTVKAVALEGAAIGLALLLSHLPS